MRVVIHLDGASVRGNERQAALIGRGLRDRGHEVVVACRRGGAVERLMAAERLATAPVRPRGDLDAVSLLRFTAWLRGQRPDALLLTSWKRAFTAGLAARRAGVPRIVQRLGGPHPIRPGVRGWKQRAALTRWPHLLVFNSEGLRDDLLRALPSIPTARTRIVHSGTDVAPDVAGPDLFGPDFGRAALRRELGVPAGAVVFLAVGGLDPLKGYEGLIDALPRLGPDVHVAIAGGGPEARVSALRDRAAATPGVGGRLHLLGHRDDIPRLLAGADALVHASRIDSLPNAILEAMRAGLPIVSTDVYGARDALAPRDGRPAAGWIVPRKDVDALGRALAAVAAGLRGGGGGGDAATPRDVAAAGAEARWRAEHWFTVEAMIDGYEAALAGDAAPVPPGEPAGTEGRGA